MKKKNTSLLCLKQQSTCLLWKLSPPKEHLRSWIPSQKAIDESGPSPLRFSFLGQLFCGESRPHWSFLSASPSWIPRLREHRHSAGGKYESIKASKKLAMTQQHIKEPDICPAQTLHALPKEHPPTFYTDWHWYLASSDNVPQTMRNTKAPLPSLPITQCPSDKNNNSCHSLSPYHR